MAYTIDVYPDIELAEVLCEQYNGYAAYMEDWPELDPEEVLSLLEGAILPEDLKYLVEDEYGRGLLMGLIRMLHELNQVPSEGEDDDGDDE